MYIYMYNLILPKWMCQSTTASFMFRVPLSWSTLYIVVWKCIVSWFSFSSFDLLLFSQNTSLEFIHSSNFRWSAIEAVILLLLRKTLCSNFKMCSVLILLFYFDLQLFTQSESVLLHLLRNTLHIVILKCIVSWY